MYRFISKFGIVAIFIFLVFFTKGVIAQNNVAINATGALPHSSAALDISADDKGILIPRMTAVQRIAIASPADGLMVYDTDTMCVLVYRLASTSWFSLCNTSSGVIGADGLTTLVSATVEPAGVNCANGGQMLQFGLDVNVNGILDAGEINAALTRYVCNGDDGPIGPAGPAGAIGPAGPAGPAGPTGLTGATGPAGAIGPIGPAGPTGLTGATGATGPAGAIGPIGPAGPTGLTGATGPAGPQGIQGPAGAIGPAGPTGLTGATGPAGPQGIQGIQGPAGALACTNVNYVLKSDGVQAVCSQIFDNATNVGIGTIVPTQKLDVAGAVKFSNALMPNNDPGTSGQILQSQGAGIAPIWTNPVKTYSVTGTTDALCSSGSWVSCPQMTYTFTPSKSTVNILFSAAGYGYTNSLAYVAFRVRVNGTVIRGTNEKIQSLYDDGFTTYSITTWSASLILPVSVNIGAANTIDVQWMRGGTYGTTNAVNYCSSQPNNCHRTLMIIE